MEKETKKTDAVTPENPAVTEQGPKSDQAIGYLDDAALEVLKTSHKVKFIHEVLTIDEEGNSHVTYFKKPTLDGIQLLASYAKKEREMDGLKVLFNSCRLAGSEEVLIDDEMLVAAYTALATIFKRREAIVKKR